MLRFKTELNSTPMRAPPQLRWHYVLRCAGAQRSQEQSSLACLKVHFQTRLRSIICAEGRYATPSQERKISPARAKTKNKECPKGQSLFLVNNCNFDTNSSLRSYSLESAESILSNRTSDMHTMDSICTFPFVKIKVMES